MRQYCSVCKSHYEMDVVRESSEDGVVWLRCPNCQGILPHMPDTEAGGKAPPASGTGSDASTTTSSSDTATAEPEAVVDEGPDPLEDIDIDSARAYTPQDLFEIGDVVHHRGWDDYGVVVTKDSLPGNRSMIRVRFVENGEVQLIEGASA